MKKAVWSMAGILLIAGAGCAQKLAPPQFQPSSIPEKQVVAARDLTWANRSWIGDNKHYQQIRASIGTSIKQGQSADALRQQYGIAAQQKPQDPTAQYAWAYAAWIASRSRTIFSGKAYDDLWGVREAMAAVPDPHTYDFYRLRFLFGGGPKLLPLGMQLLQVDPQDIDVKVGVIRMTLDKPSARASCRQLIDAYPENPRFRSLLADIYVSAWEKSRDESDRQKAIAATNDFLKMSPPDDKRLGDAQYLLKLLSTSPKVH